MAATVGGSVSFCSLLPAAAWPEAGAPLAVAATMGRSAGLSMADAAAAAVTYVGAAEAAGTMVGTVTVAPATAAAIASAIALAEPAAIDA